MWAKPPAAYVAEHVELGYAATVHRAQGITVDTAHVLADAAISREAAYVGLTRGRHENRLYVETEGAQPMTDVLDAIARNAIASMSAHEAIRAEQHRVSDLITLIDQYADIAHRADHLRFTQIGDDTLGPTAPQVTRTESWPALMAALRHAELAGYDPATTLTAAVAQRELDTATDVPAVLYARIETALTQHPATHNRPGETPVVPEWIADPAPLSAHTLDESWRAHLRERYDHLAARLAERGEALAANPPAWAAHLGPLPTAPVERDAWVRLAAEVSVFRDRYRIPEDTTAAIPDQYRTAVTGEALTARITALHASDEPRQHVQTDAAGLGRNTLVEDVVEDHVIQTPAEKIAQWRQQHHDKTQNPPTRDGWTPDHPTPTHQHSPRR